MGVTHKTTVESRALVGLTLLWLSPWRGLLGLFLFTLGKILWITPPAALAQQTMHQPHRSNRMADSTEIDLWQPQNWRQFDVVPIQHSPSDASSPVLMAAPEAAVEATTGPSTTKLPAAEPATAEPTVASAADDLPAIVLNPLDRPRQELEGPAEAAAFQPWLASSYRLAVGDRLGVIVQNIPELTAQYQVQLDGSLHLPLLDPLPVWGLTLAETAQRIEQTYEEADILRAPSVSLSLLTMAPLRIAITGEVARPGAYRLDPLDTNVPPTLTEALRQAGGITQRTNLQEIHIDRRYGNGQTRRTTVNLWQLLRQGDLSQDVTLRNGDSIVLETAPPVDVAQAIALGRSNVAQTAVRVGIWGETNQTGTFEVPPNTPLNQVLLAAGGFTDRANRKTVDLIRLQPNGTVSQQTIEVDLTASVEESSNPIVRDLDIIHVQPSGLFRLSDRIRRTVAPLSDTVSSVLQPVGSVFSILNVFELFSNFFGFQRDR